MRRGIYVPSTFWDCVKRGAGLAIGVFVVNEAVDIIKHPVKRKKLKEAGKNIKEAVTGKKTES